MKDLIKGAVFGAVVTAVVTVSVNSLIDLGGEPENSLVRAIQSGRTTAPNPRCTSVQLKMPCFQSGSGS
jgi:hypothetical protein